MKRIVDLLAWLVIFLFIAAMVIGVIAAMIRLPEIALFLGLVVIISWAATRLMRKL